ncbi:MAG: hypothetical protein PHG95_01295 [Patescibacteria group bacterium]|nr:hypothetical protein [Patescibacteria group bacterium]
MMFTLSFIFLAAVFFLILGKGADLLVGNLRAVADRTKIHPVLLGTILGFLTTIPEFMVGLNAVRQGVPAISLGNIWGGIIVIFGLILGMSIVLQREIKTDGRILVILPSFIFIIFSLFLGLKGGFHYYDGLLLVAFYLTLIYLDYLSGSHYQADSAVVEQAVTEQKPQPAWRRLEEKFLFWRRELRREILWALIGLFLVSLSSYVIMEIADIALGIFPIAPFLVGLLVFAIGTNLPEITVMLRSLKTKSGDLSFGHLVGSAASNILVLSLLTFITPIPLSLSWRYYVLILFVVIILSAVSIFYVTGKKFQRWEGIILICLYLSFILYEFL